MTHQLTRPLSTICICIYFYRHFHGINLETLNSTMLMHLQALLKDEMPHNQLDWKEEGLFNLSYSFLFKYEPPPPLPNTQHKCS